MKNLYTTNNKTLMKEIEENTNNWKAIPFTQNWHNAVGHWLHLPPFYSCFVLLFVHFIIQGSHFLCWYLLRPLFEEDLQAPTWFVQLTKGSKYMDWWKLGFPVYGKQHNVKRTSSESRLPGFEPKLCHLLAMWS